MADRFDKFTERARRVLTLAQEEAQRFNHNYIGTEHLLLGLVREGDGVAAKVLNNLGVELSKVRSAVEFIIGRGEIPFERVDHLRVVAGLFIFFRQAEHDHCIRGIAHEHLFKDFDTGLTHWFIYSLVH